MLRNYFTLYHLARELHDRLAGGYVFEIYSQQKNEITIACITPEGGHLQIHVVTNHPDLCLYTREGINRKSRNTAGLMPETEEKGVLGVTIDPCDRIVRMELEEGFSLVLRLFSAKTNVLLEKEGKVISAFKKERPIDAPETRELAFPRPDILRTLEPLAYDPALFAAAYRAAPGDDPKEKLPAMLPGFDRGLTRELLARSGEHRDPLLIGEVFSVLFHELLDPTPSVRTAPHEKPSFSLLPRPEADALCFANVIEALDAYSAKTWQHLSTRRHAGELQQRLRHKQKKIRSEMAHSDPGELGRQAELYERYGHLLIASLHRRDRRPDSIELVDVMDPSAPTLTVPLKPELNLQQNASRWFDKASRTREKLEGAKRRAAEVARQQEEIERLVKLADDLSSPAEVRRFNSRHGALLKALGLADRGSGTKQPPFRRIDITRKATLYVGKNARNNEQLTFSFARPRDIWLHARGASGSHCVLRGATMQNGSEIRRAAEIAAFYSSARNSELVPVMYCEKKHVRRSKNMPPGQVAIEKENVIMVRPRL